MARTTGAAVATILGFVLLLAAYALYYPGFDTAHLTSEPSLLFLILGGTGLLLLLGGIAKLTEGLGPP